MEKSNKILIAEKYNCGTRFKLPLLAQDTFNITLHALINEFSEKSCAKVIREKDYCKICCENKIIEIKKDYVFLFQNLVVA